MGKLIYKMLSESDDLQWVKDLDKVDRVEDTHPIP